MIFDKLLDSARLFLTGYTDIVYLSLFLDLAKDGPTVYVNWLILRGSSWMQA